MVKSTRISFSRGGHWIALFWIGCFVLAGCVMPVIGGGTPYSTVSPVGPSPEATAIQTEASPPSETPTVSFTPTLESREPEEPVVVFTPTPSFQPTETPTPITRYAYELQEGSPGYLPNVFHSDLGCGWFGVAGQIFDEQGQPVSGIIVEIEGNLDGQPILHLGISGGAPQYGNGGYEVVLGDQPKTSENELTIVLHDTGGNQLTDRIPFVTSDSCTQNLVIMNFLATGFFESEFYLPLLNKSE
jgi:hypothetical protein